MPSIYTLCQQSWNTLVYSRRSLLTMFLLSITPTVLMLLGIWIVTGGAWALAYFGIPIPVLWEVSIWIMIGLGIIGVAIFVGFLLLALVCSYLSMRILANNFRKKHESFKTLLSHWRESVNFFWLGLTLFIYTVGWILIGSLSLLLVFIHQVFLIPAALFVIGLSFYKTLPLVMASGIFFFEGVSGFQAIKQSQLLVRWRWWKTVWYIAVLILISLWVVLVLGLGEWGWTSLMEMITKNSPLAPLLFTSLVSILGIIGLLLQTLVQMLLKFYYSSYLFGLYKAYSKHHSLSKK